MISLKDALAGDCNVAVEALLIKLGALADRAEFSRTDGTMRLRGDATAWVDMVGDLFGKRLASTAGTISYDYEDNAITFSAGGIITNVNDRVGANLQINHNMKVGSGIVFSPHFHWWQQITTGAVSPFVWSMRYRFQRNGYAKTTDWTTVTATAGTNDVFDFTGEVDGLYSQLTSFPDITIDCDISDTFQFQVTRTDAEVGDVNVYFIDLHGEVDSFGSNLILSKTA